MVMSRCFFFLAVRIIFSQNDFLRINRSYLKHFFILSNTKQSHLNYIDFVLRHLILIKISYHITKIPGTANDYHTLNVDK